MTGLLLLFVAGIWFVLALIMTVFIVSKIPAKAWRGWISIPLFLLLLPMPVMDEIIGGRQFEQLCKNNSTIQVDRKTAVGRTVYLKDVPDEIIKDKWMPMRLERWRFVDATTGELVMSYNILHATRSWLRLTESGYPFTFDGYCSPNLGHSFIDKFAEYGITYIRPTTKLKEATK